MVGGGILGKAVESVLKRRGHEVIVLSKRTGFDVTEPKTMAPRSGIDAVVEATDVFTQKFDVARDFFTTSTRNIDHWAQESGIDKHVLVSIVNCEIDAMSSNGYYAGKARRGSPWRRTGKPCWCARPCGTSSPARTSTA